MQKYILFGAGRYVSSFIHIIRFFGGDIIYLTDNSEKKVGKYYENIEIISPEALKSKDNKILISCVYYDEIKKQLVEYGIDSQEITLFECLNELCKEKRPSYLWELSGNNKHDLYFDLYSGAKWGGAENWNIRLTGELIRKNPGGNIAIIGDDIVEIKENNEVALYRFKKENAVNEILEQIQKSDTVTFVNSFFGESCFVMMALKLLYPKRVKLVTVVHNDYKDLYVLCSMFRDFTDQYLCVSSKICNTLQKSYMIDDRVIFLHQPISFDVTYKKIYVSDEPIKIGIASRLTVQQKRCDLIPKFIDELSYTGIKFEVHIAGNGDMLDEICSYISSKKLNDRVFLHGHLEYSQMEEFWKRQDIYVNLSEFEGTSLAMLEAMSYSCVPVVTDVSGVRDFIIDDRNGYIHNIGDIKGICNSVVHLSKNREKLKKFGELAQKQIFEKCDIRDYADKFISIIGGIK